MKKKQARATIFACIILMALSVVALPCIAADEAQDEIAAFVAKWKETYGGQIGWEPWPVSEAIAVPSEEDMSREDALAIALRAACEGRAIEVAYFEGHRPFLSFTENGTWMISLLPSDENREPIWCFFIEVDSKTGELLNYREVEPFDFDSMDDSVVPKG